MPAPKTLLALAGAATSPGNLGDSGLVLIDCQNEYVTGKLPLAGVSSALDQIAALLARARAAKTPIIHVVHKGRPGGLFDLAAESGRIAGRVAAAEGETIVEKTLPNAFAGTNLREHIDRTGRKNLIFVGFQTHMCVGSTVHAALDAGYRSTVVARATATRDLPDIEGGVVTAAALNSACLAGLSDRFATVVTAAADISV